MVFRSPVPIKVFGAEALIGCHKCAFHQVSSEIYVFIFRRGSSRRGSAHDEDKRGSGCDGNKPSVARQQRPYRRDSRINSFMAFTHHADAITDAVFNTGPKYHMLRDSAPPKYHAVPMSHGQRRPKLPSTTDDSTDEIACLKAERKVKN